MNHETDKPTVDAIRQALHKLIRMVAEAIADELVESSSSDTGEGQAIEEVEEKFE